MLNFHLIEFILIAFYFVFVLFSPKFQHKTIHFHTWSFLFFFYILTVIDLTLFPIPVDKHLIHDIKRYHMYTMNNFVPFATIKRFLKIPFTSVSFKNIYGNILLLMPLGFFVCLFWIEKYSFFLILLIGIVCSLCIETSQFIFSFFVGFPYRCFDVDDILLNSIGYVVSVVAFGIFYVKMKKAHLKSNK